MIRRSVRLEAGVRPDDQAVEVSPGGDPVLGVPVLGVAEDDLAELLHADREWRGVLGGILGSWVDSGVICWGGFYLGADDGWVLVAERGQRDVESAFGPLDGSFDSVPAGPWATVIGDFACFALGRCDDEVARLLVQLVTPSARLRISGYAHVSLALFLDRARALGSESVMVAFTRKLRAEQPPQLECARERFPEIVGQSAPLRHMLGLVERAAPTAVTVLIQGESGTGKELIARSIHALSKRSAGPFVSENCAAFSPTLLEAEIFGSEKGSYTGAHQTRLGLLERAQGGTLFLDEIGEMDLRLQSKLLRVLQEREVRRVGGNQVIPVDFRLITATHRDLTEEVRAGRFREDLLFRILVIRIEVPPLRARREDIPMLIEHFLAEFAAEHGVPVPKVDRDALQHLVKYAWPGNIRELRNEMERALALTPDRLTMNSLSERLQEPFFPRSVARRVRKEIGTDLRDLERAVLGGVIREVLEETGGNKTRAAEILGLPKTSLYRRLEWYGIECSVDSSPAGAANPSQRLLGDG
ncbi:MAG: sigma-54 interaction domain-containing protein [Planctomycetota bacterium]